MSVLQSGRQSCSRSQAFAIITPISHEAIGSLGVHHNASFLATKSNIKEPLRLNLDFGSIFGRTSLSFGSSHHDNIMLYRTADDNVEARHFVIHFEMQTGLLLLTDTSQSGTWISNAATLTSTLLKSTTYPLTHSTIVVLGREHQFRILLTVTDYARSSTFAKLFDAYAKSINRPVPNFVRPLCTSCSKSTTIQGTHRYVRLHKVAKGGFGTVYTCLRIADGTLFAVKTCPTRQSATLEDQAKISKETAMNELNLLKRARHPNIVRFVDCVPSSWAIIIEFLPLGSLGSLLDRWQPCSLHVSFCQAVLRQCLVAIQYLNNHMDLIHHDLKPDNILLVSITPTRIKLCDFGGARSIISAHATPSLIPYTPGYAAPEFYSKSHGFGVDVYALGIVTLNMLGFWPWDAFMIELPDYCQLPCADLLDSMLELNVRKRYRPADCLNHSWLQRPSCSKKRPLSVDTTSYYPPHKRQRLTGSPRFYSENTGGRCSGYAFMVSVLDSAWKSASCFRRAPLQ